MVPLMGDTQNGQIHSQKAEWWLPGAGRRGRRRAIVSWVQSFLFGRMKNSGNKGW